MVRGQALAQLLRSGEPPTVEIAPDQLEHQRHLIVAVVQTRDIAVLLAARLQKHFAILLSDFFQRLQTVNGKTRAERVDALNPALRPCFEGLVCVGL